MTIGPALGGARERPPEPPLRVVVCGDFSGRGSKAASSSVDLTPIEFDRDDVEARLAELRPTVTLRIAEEPLPITFSALSDFHPDALYERLPPLMVLRAALKRLADPAVFREQGDEPARVDAQALLDQVVEATDLATAGPDLRSAVGGDLAQYIQRLIGPYLVPAVTSEQAKVLKQLDDTLAERLREVLHDPAFRALEGLWRGLDFVARRTETGSALKLYLLDVSKLRLSDLLLSGDKDILASPMYQTLAGETAWSLLAGAYEFDNSTEDLRLLGRLGELARALGASWIGGAAPSLAEPAPDRSHLRDQRSAAWHTFRTTPPAQWIGLAYPRFLGREPYGEATDPCETTSLKSWLGLPTRGRTFGSLPPLRGWWCSRAAILAPALTTWKSRDCR